MNAEGHARAWEKLEAKRLKLRDSQKEHRDPLTEAAAKILKSREGFRDHLDIDISGVTLGGEVSFSVRDFDGWDDDYTITFQDLERADEIVVEERAKAEAMRRDAKLEQAKLAEERAISLRAEAEQMEKG